MSEDRHNFRLWDIEWKKYVPTRDILLGPKGILWKDPESPKFHGYAVNDLYILEFCAGVKDRRGNLIFDGDIIRECWYEDWKENPVIFHDFHHCAVIEWAQAYSGFLWCSVDIKGGTTDFYGGIPEDCVIVGNRNEDSLEALEKARESTA